MAADESLPGFSECFWTVVSIPDQSMPQDQLDTPTPVVAAGQGSSVESVPPVQLDMDLSPLRVGLGVEPVHVGSEYGEIGDEGDLSVQGGSLPVSSAGEDTHSLVDDGT